MKIGLVNEIIGKPLLINKTLGGEHLTLARTFLRTIAQGKAEAFKRPLDEEDSEFYKTWAIGLNTGSYYNESDEDDENEFDIPNEPFVGIVNVQGAIMRKDYCGSIGTDTMQMLMSQYARMQNCMAIMLMIDSPGGSASGLTNFANFISSLNVPTYAVVENLCCSAAYYIACACDKIYAQQNDCFLGSIGVYVTLFDYTKMEEAGEIPIEKEVYASQSTQKNDIIQQALDGNIEPLQTEILDVVAQEFIDTVKKYRPQLTDASAFAGKTYAAKNAPVGMIDGIKTTQAIIDEIKNLPFRSPFN